MHARTMVRASLGLALSISAAATLTAAPIGAPDARFGSGGVVTTDFLGGADAASAVAVLDDGRVVAAGSAGTGKDGRTRFALARYRADGALDPAFGASGRVTTAIGQSAAALALAVDGEGRYVAAGRSCAAPASGNCRMAVARYLESGALDPSFGAGGVAKLALGAKDGQATGVAVLPSGRLVVSGTLDGLFALARLDPDGALDRTFGLEGVSTLSFPGASDAWALLAEPAGELVVGGSAFGPEDHDFAVAMFDADGRADVLCGVLGRVRTDFDGAHDAAYALALAKDGGLLVAGEATTAGSPTTFAIEKLRADGSADTSFGTAGHAFVRFPAAAHLYALRVLPTGTIVAAGVLARSGSDSDIALAFLTPEGRFDWSFGTFGIVTRDLGGLDAAYALAVAPAGRVVAAGSVSTPHGSDFAVARWIAALPGDANWDGVVDAGDLFALLNHLFGGAPAPIGLADANGDGRLDVADMFALINYLYAGGPAPF